MGLMGKHNFGSGKFCLCRLTVKLAMLIVVVAFVPTSAWASLDCGYRVITEGSCPELQKGVHGCPVRRFKLFSSQDANVAEVIVEIYDRNGQFDFPARSFDPVFKDPLVGDQLRFLHHRALSRSQGESVASFRAVVNGFKTQVSAESAAPRLPQEGMGPSTVVLSVFYEGNNPQKGPFPEAPELAVVGIVSELFSMKSVNFILIRGIN